jgi:hypothetical protein
MTFQSNEEIIRVADEWFRNFCPLNLIKTGAEGSKNAEAIISRCLQKYGILTISGLTEAAHELGAAHLDLVPTQPELTPAEKQALAAKKAEERMRRDYLDSIKPQPSYDERVKAEQAKKVAEDAAKLQAQAESTLKLAIDSYETYRGPGRVDFAKTESLRAQLRKIEVRRNKKRDAVLTLQKVREAISNMP